MVFRYSTSLSNLPAEIALRVEGAVHRIVKRAHSSGIAIEYMVLYGRLLHGVTGRDILKLRVSTRGYSSVSAPEDVLKSIISDFLREETGFETRVVMKDCSFGVVQKVPPVRLRAQVLGFCSGRFLRSPELLSAPKDTSCEKDISLSKVSSTLIDALSGMGGVFIKDVRLSRGEWAQVFISLSFEGRISSGCL